MRALIALLPFLLFVTPLQALEAAKDPSTRVSDCIYQSLSTQDKTTLKQWAFVIAAQDPAVRHLSRISDEVKGQTFTATTLVFRRIILNQCANVMLDTLRLNDPTYFQVAMQQTAAKLGLEFMNSDAVATALSDFSNQMAGVLFELALTGAATK